MVGFGVVGPLLAKRLILDAKSERGVRAGVATRDKWLVDVVDGDWGNLTKAT